MLYLDLIRSHLKFLFILWYRHIKSYFHCYKENITTTSLLYLCKQTQALTMISFWTRKALAKGHAICTSVGTRPTCSALEFSEIRFELSSSCLIIVIYLVLRKIRTATTENVSFWIWNLGNVRSHLPDKSDHFFLNAITDLRYETKQAESETRPSCKSGVLWIVLITDSFF